MTEQEAYDKGYKQGYADRIEMERALRVDDCISREDATNKVAEILERVFVENIDIAEKAMGSLPSVKPTRTKGEWIPTSERLPKAGEYIGDVDKYYLVQNEYGDMLVARYTHSEYWEQIYQLQPIGDEIVAWMPLPEPYTAESEVTQ